MGVEPHAATPIQHRHDGQPTNSVRSATRILRVLAANRSPMGVTEIAREAALSKTTAHRLVSTLVECGLVERQGTKYAIGLGSATIGAAYEGASGRATLDFLRETATPFLQELFGKTKETVHLAVLDGAEVYYVDKIFGTQPVRIPSRIGSRLPATCTAVGKMLLAESGPDILGRVVPSLRRLTPYSQAVPDLLAAELLRIREDALAFDHEEAALGLLCVASPIINSRGKTIAAVSVAGPSSRFNVAVNSVAVQRTAEQISEAIRSHERQGQVAG